MTGAAKSHGLVIFSHGRSSSPKAKKISKLQPVAAEMGWRTLAPDYSFTQEPSERIAHLLKELEPHAGPYVLWGSSMGGVVSVFASQQIDCLGMFLLAPAVYWPGFEDLDYSSKAPMIEVVHGWRDEVVPVELSVRFAREHCATLHILDDDHSLVPTIDKTEVLFRDFLRRIRAKQVER